jgi:hypothetical protein
VHTNKELSIDNISYLGFFIVVIFSKMVQRNENFRIILLSDLDREG